MTQNRTTLRRHSQVAHRNPSGDTQAKPACAGRSRNTRCQWNRPLGLCWEGPVYAVRRTAAVALSGCAARFWHHAGSVALLVPVGRVVLLYHGGRDAPALPDSQAVLFRPGADITRALAVCRDPPGAARRCPPGPAG